MPLPAYFLHSLQHTRNHLTAAHGAAPTRHNVPLPHGAEPHGPPTAAANPSRGRGVAWSKAGERLGLPPGTGTVSAPAQGGMAGAAPMAAGSAVRGGGREGWEATRCHSPAAAVAAELVSGTWGSAAPGSASASGRRRHRQPPPEDIDGARRDRGGAVSRELRPIKPRPRAGRSPSWKRGSGALGSASTEMTLVTAAATAIVNKLETRVFPKCRVRTETHPRYLQHRGCVVVRRRGQRRARGAGGRAPAISCLPGALLASCGLQALW